MTNQDDIHCYECGKPCVVNDDGTSNHVLELGADRTDEDGDRQIGDIDYDTDDDHVAIPEYEDE